jgi:hypothetical protein
VEDSKDRCCGNCEWFDGEIGDGDQFCDELEAYVNDVECFCNNIRGGLNDRTLRNDLQQNHEQRICKHDRRAVCYYVRTRETNDNQ